MGGQVFKIIKYENWSKVKYSSEHQNHIPREIILHHSYIPRKNRAGKQTIRNIQKYHIQERKWIDIGYHYLIDKNGVVYEGRKKGHIGAHCVPNTARIGICIIGNYDDGMDTLSDKAYKSLIELLVDICYKDNIKISGIKGHRDYNKYKTCPGEQIYGMLSLIRSDVRLNLDKLEERFKDV